MKFLTLVFTNIILFLTLSNPTNADHGGSRVARTQKSLGKRLETMERAPILDLGNNLPPRKLSRRSCKPRPANSTSPETTTIAPTATEVLDTGSTTTPAASPAPAPVTSVTPTTSSETTANTPVSAPSPESGTGHLFTLTNQCSKSITPAVADTKCGYSPRCAGASSYTGPPPGTLAPGQTETITINADWVGRIFAKDNCGPSGEDCTVLEFNLDSGSFYTPQAYDISNIQGFTQSVSLGASGCDTVTCTNPNCGCENAYPIGDESGCGSDLPVRACGAGPIGFKIVFCP